MLFSFLKSLVREAVEFLALFFLAFIPFERSWFWLFLFFFERIVSYLIRLSLHPFVLTFSLLFGLRDLLVSSSKNEEQITFKGICFKSFFRANYLVDMGIYGLCFFDITCDIIVDFPTLNTLGLVTDLISVPKDHSLFE